MRINELIDCDYNTEIVGIVDDSRLVKKNYLFVATKGYNIDHYDYIGSAIKNGCSFVICDRDIDYDIDYLVVDDINNLFYKLCRKFYNIDLDNYNFIGITGTDGKTTTSSIVRELIPNCAYIGTNGVGLTDRSIGTNNTTPCVSELYGDLKYIHDNKYNNVVMEVSSEALLHDRVKELRYSIVGFTNISEDHLNIHGSFKNYVDSKMKLLDLLLDNGIVIVNGDDEILNGICHERLYSFGFNSNNDYVISDVVYKNNRTYITINNSINIISPFIGRYNVYNVVMAYLIGMFYGVSSDILISKIKNLGTIKGRCEFLDFGQDYDIVLDYAHTTNGVRNILSTFDGRRIICVTGCAGGREKSKRREIGSLIMNSCDVSIFTMDDPRWESVDSIIDDMVDGDDNYIRITDRVKAINYALSIASSGCVVLILGKGRDNYMAIGDKKEKYCDYDVVYNYFNGGIL